MSRLYLVRHGVTEWNKEHRSQGCSNDIPLSEEGLRQADLVAKRFRDVNIDVIYSSHLKRAAETARRISEHHQLAVEVLEDFKEINLGDWEGLTFPHIKENYLEIYTAWRDTPHLARIPNAETLVNLKERSVNKLMEILELNKGKDIMVVSHGITIKVIIAALAGIDLANIHKIRQDNTAVNVFEYDEEKGFEIVTINDTCHLGVKEVVAFNGV